MLDQACVAFSYVYRSIRGTLRGKQPLPGTGMMGDCTAYGPGVQHDGADRDTARCSQHRIAHLI